MKKFFCKTILIVISFIMCLSCFSACNFGGFTVTFDANGGYLLSGELVQKVKSADEIVEPIVARTGYAEGQGGYYWDTIINSITKNATVYAVWYVNDYVFHYETVISYTWQQQVKQQTFSVSDNNISTPYGRAVGANLAVASSEKEDDLRFSYWYVFAKDGVTQVKVETTTVINDDFFVNSLGYTRSEAQAFRGKTVELKLKWEPGWTENH